MPLLVSAAAEATVSAPPLVCIAPVSVALPPLRRSSRPALSVPETSAVVAASSVIAAAATVLPRRLRLPRLRTTVSPVWLPTSPRLSSCPASTRKVAPATSVPLLSTA
nr:hypothetical protein [Xanthomonas campestris]